MVRMQACVCMCVRFWMIKHVGYETGKGRGVYNGLFPACADLSSDGSVSDHFLIVQFVCYR